MDISVFTELGLAVNMPVAIATIFVSSFAFKMVKQKSENAYVHVLIPFVVALVITGVYEVAHDGIGRIIVWNGVWNAIVSIGMYSPVESFLRKQGWLK